jgi:hypothetical protein
MNENIIKVKTLLKDINTKDTEIGKLKDEIKQKESEFIEMTRKYDTEIMKIDVKS